MIIVPDDTDTGWPEAAAVVAPAPVVLVRGHGPVKSAHLVDDRDLAPATRALAEELVRRLGQGTDIAVRPSWGWSVPETDTDRVTVIVPPVATAPDAPTNQPDARTTLRLDRRRPPR